MNFRLTSSSQKAKKWTCARELGTRSELLRSALDLFAQKGFHGATVKEIAQLSGANICLISYYFGGKEALYRECLETLSQERYSVVEQILAVPQNAEEFGFRIRLLIEQFLHFHLENRAATRILFQEIQRPNPAFMDIFKDTFYRVYLRVMDFFIAAKTNGILRLELDPEFCCSIFFGNLTDCLLFDESRKILKNQSIEDLEYRKKWIDQFVLVYLKGVVCETAS